MVGYDAKQHACGVLIASTTGLTRIVFPGVEHNIIKFLSPIA
jgi:hypothetical protein